MKHALKIRKWIMLSLAIISNSFIIFYSCLSEKATLKLEQPFTGFFVNIVNTFSKKEVKNVPLESIQISFSNDQYNNIPGYELNEIPLGSAKEIVCNFLPDNASNRGITYYVNPSDSFILNQSGSKLSAIGMKVGNYEIVAQSSDGSFISKLPVKVVETVAPINYEISLSDTDLFIGNPKTLLFDVDGGVLTHNELVNFRYYDIRKLEFSSSDETIATIDNYGVVRPLSVGLTQIKVSNGIIEKEIDIRVHDGESPSLYTNLEISGDNFCYSNDMILGQNSNKYQHQLIIKDGTNTLNPEDFIWNTSNELLARVDRHGVLRGFRKATNVDENVVVTAKSKITGQETSFNVVVKNQLPTEIYTSYVLEGQTYWNQNTAIFSVGDNVELIIHYDIYIQNRTVTVSSSNEEVASATSEGDKVYLNIKKAGNSVLNIQSVVNPDLTIKVNIKSVPAGSIKSSSVGNVGTYLRKSIGHAAVFMVAQIFTYITLYLFLFDKKWWLYSSISLSEGLIISAISELIQYFVPSRTGLFIDVLIDFIGVLIGFMFAFLVILIIKKSRRNIE